jgi:hypothetical protein
MTYNYKKENEVEFRKLTIAENILLASVLITVFLLGLLF